MTLCPVTGHQCHCQPDEGHFCDGAVELRKAVGEWKNLAHQREYKLSLALLEKHRLREDMHLAEAGLAGYAQELEKLREEHRIWDKHSLVQVVEENQQLKRALNFWLPIVPEDAPLDESPVLSRIERDGNLLFNFEGESDDKCAAELGWIELCVEAQIRELCPECLEPKPCAQHPTGEPGAQQHK